MLKNYLKTTIRNLRQHKGYSVINLAGLTLGMTCGILILLYVQHELSYDRYHENAENVYRIVIKHPRVFRGSDMLNVTPAAMAPAITEEFPEVIRATRVYSGGGPIRYLDKMFDDDRFYYVDSEFLDIFTFPLLSGNPQTALKEQNSVLLSEEMALKYFGEEEPVGKTITLDNRYDFTVTGILENVPKNSHFRFDFLASFITLKSVRGREDLNSWNDVSYKTYALLRADADYKEVNKKIPDFTKKYLTTGILSQDRYVLQPLTGIHLSGNMNFELEANSDIRYVYLFTAIAVFIMVIACFNYMNLSTARSATRAKEVGMRKIAGAGRFNLVTQFLGESVIFSLGALVFSLIPVILFLPAYNSLIQRELSLSLLLNFKLLAGLTGVIIFTGLVSGSYPALLLSSYKPINVLKGIFSSGKKGASGSSAFRNTLVTAQFVIGIVLIICTIIIQDQLHYIRDKNLGYAKEHVIAFSLRSRNLRKDSGALKNELGKYPGIVDITTSNSTPVNIGSANIPDWEGMEEGMEPVVYQNLIDYNFIDFYGLEILKGRNFLKEFGSDTSNAIILNEAAVNLTGWDEPIGKQFDEVMVIGVVKDFHFAPLHQQIQPLMLRLRNTRNSMMSVKINSSNIPQTLSFIEEKWNKFSPEYPFVYSFLDDRVNRMYGSEQRLGRTFNYFTFIAVFIACLGLFGLASFTAQKRTKEIGIRKVLGASVPKITYLLAKEFIKWVIAANLIAWPVAYYGMSKWLQNFAYHTNLSIQIFIFTTFIAIFIALLTVSYQTVRAAVANPIDSLRYE